jgi:hypothetical protein
VGRVLQEAIREAQSVQAEAERSGWTSDLVGRALTVLRIGATAAVGRPVAQRPMERGATVQSGELEVPPGILRGRRAVVSGSATAAAVGADPSLEDLAEALRVFAAAHYRRTADLDGSALDGAFAGGRRVLADVAARYGWRARTVGALSGAAARARDKVWRR